MTVRIQPNNLKS